MDVKQEKLKQIAHGIFRTIGTFKYALLILAVGIVLISIPSKGSDVQNQVEPCDQEVREDLSSKLEEIVGKIHGAGKTKVLLSMENGPTNTYQMNSELQYTDEGERSKTDTVLISTGSGTEEALLIAVTYPSYRGAVVICEGADSPTVRLNVIHAVSSLTGLSSDKIAVIKMSSN